MVFWQCAFPLSYFSIRTPSTCHHAKTCSKLDVLVSGGKVWRQPCFETTRGLSVGSCGERQTGAEDATCMFTSGCSKAEQMLHSSTLHSPQLERRAASIWNQGIQLHHSCDALSTGRPDKNSETIGLLVLLRTSPRTLSMVLFFFGFFFGQALDRSVTWYHGNRSLLWRYADRTRGRGAAYASKHGRRVNTRQTASRADQSAWSDPLWTNSEHKTSKNASWKRSRVQQLLTFSRSSVVLHEGPVSCFSEQIAPPCFHITDSQPLFNAL